MHQHPRPASKPSVIRLWRCPLSAHAHCGLGQTTLVPARLRYRSDLYFEAGKVMIHAQVFGSWLVSYYVILISSVLCHTVIALFVYQPLEDVVHWLFMHYQVMDLEAGKVMVHARVFGSWLVVYYVILLLHYSYSMSACFVTQTLQLRMQSDTI